MFATHSWWVLVIRELRLEGDLDAAGTRGPPGQGDVPKGRELTLGLLINYLGSLGLYCQRKAIHARKYVVGIR